MSGLVSGAASQQVLRDKVKTQMVLVQLCHPFKS